MEYSALEYAGACLVVQKYFRVVVVVGDKKAIPQAGLPSMSTGYTPDRDVSKPAAARSTRP